MKNWDEITRNLTSPEASDEEDDLNIMSVQRNAHRVAELLHGSLPFLDETQMRTLPSGTNKLDFMRQGLARAMSDASHRSPEASSHDEDASRRYVPSWDALMTPRAFQDPQNSSDESFESRKPFFPSAPPPTPKQTNLVEKATEEANSTKPDDVRSSHMNKA